MEVMLGILDSMQKDLDILFVDYTVPIKEYFSPKYSHYKMLR